MFRWPRAPHEDQERTAFLGAAVIVAASVVVSTIWLAFPGKVSSPALETLSVVLAAGLLLFLPYWLITVLLRRLPQDAAIFRTLEAPFTEPVEWGPILGASPNVSALNSNDRARLGRLIALFLNEVRFEGAGGLVISDEIRLTIAAQASLLTLNLPRGALGRLRTILVYPTAFVPRTFAWNAAPPERDPGTATLGESWTKGTVVLAWDNVLHGVSNPDDGHNVALHEFAHQLDSREGKADGVPALGSRQRYLSWVAVLEESFARFSREARKGRPGAIDGYGATSPAEFFAVGTESFFERPRELQRQYPEFYEQLKQYYRQDPAQSRTRMPPDPLAVPEP
jgi:Mlc titration factor MtfA (ptsG expression regulator)